MFPPKDRITILFAHAAYQMKACFDALGNGIRNIEVRDADAFRQAVGDADVVVVSGMWSNDLLEHAPKLKFIQSISSGTNQYDLEALRARGIRLASAQGVNANAVSEHAMSLVLAMARRLPEARDNQHARHWRPMMGDFAKREDELGGKTLLVVGLGRIGGRLARLARAFDMHVIGVRRDPAAGSGDADSVHALAELPDLLPRADFVALTCPLTDATRGIIDAQALGRMKRTAYLINVARGGCVNENELIAALQQRRIAGAALDTTEQEPLPAASPLWDMPHVFITSHLGGETHRYEPNVLEILMENLERLWRGESALRNQVV
ncbi:MAG TPA: D-2-hydroxyacid dehydrogenase [Acetobacteraceae bacterium]|nr:D-2-hydroxyacid dehydrogenase [Acetobacteraceae bacterium]